MGAWIGCVALVVLGVIHVAVRSGGGKLRELLVIGGVFALLVGSACFVWIAILVFAIWNLRGVSFPVGPFELRPISAKTQNDEDRTPRGVTLSDITIHRFHKKKYLYPTSSDFFQTFLDSEHSVKKSGRFCSSDVNPGFFFATSPEAALYEFLFYNEQYRTPGTSQQNIESALTASAVADDEAVVLITCKISVDNILDFCESETIYRVLEQCYGSRISELAKRPLHFADLMLTLGATSKYGSSLTDLLGQYAWQHGFNGIRFFSARAMDHIKPVSYTSKSINEALRNVSWGDEYAGSFTDLWLQAKHEATNLILFRGAYIAQKVECFRVQYQAASSSWIRNDSWQKGISDIENAMTNHNGLDTEGLNDLCTGILSGYSLEVRGKRYAKFIH